MLKLAIATHLI